MTYKESKIDYTIITCGTGGHVLPALSLLEAGLKQQWKMGLIIDDKTAIRYALKIKNYKEQYGDIFTVVYTKPFYLNYKCPFILIYNLWKTKKILLQTKVCVGFIAGLQIPTLLGAILLGKKVILHEQDSILNKTNGLFAPFVHKIHSSFKELGNYKKNLWIGCPQAVTKVLETYEQKKIISILSGTNGSHIFDQYLPIILSKIAELEPILKEYLIYHNCRRENEKQVIDAYKHSGLQFTVSPYFHDFENLIKWSSFLITRAGASTIAYLSLYEKNAIIIPWKNSAQQHQRTNGNRIKNVNGAIVIDEEQIPNELEKNIIYLLHNHRHMHMGQNIQQVFKIVDSLDYLKIINATEY